jgi:hypothetical protein
MGIFKAQGLNTGKPLQHVLAFCPSSFGRFPLVGNSVSKLSLDWQ